MRVSELIEQLEELRKIEGDIMVGFQDGETGTYLAVDKVEARDQKIRKGRKFGNMFDDDEALGPRFIGLA